MSMAWSDASAATPVVPSSVKIEWYCASVTSMLKTRWSRVVELRE
jgi:hypothetical protein